MFESFVSLADTQAVDLSTLIGTFTNDVSTQFMAAAPGVITAGAGIAVVLWGVPKLICFFKSSAH